MNQLRSKLLALILPMVIVPIMLFGLISSQRIASIAHENIETNILNYASQTQRLIENILSVGQSNLELFAQHDLITQYALAAENERYNLLHPILLNTFHAFHNAYPEYSEIRFILPDGYEDVRYSNNSQNITEEELNHPAIQQLNRLGVNSTFLFSINPDNQQPVVYFARKIILNDFSKDGYDKKPQLRGYLLLTTSLDELQQHLNRMAADSQIQFMIVDQQHDPLLISQLTENQDSATDSLPVDRLQQTLKNSTFITNDAKQYDELHVELMRVVYDITALPMDNEFLLIAAYPQSLYLQEGSQLQKGLFVLVVLSILILSFFLILGLKRFVLSPLAMLNHATQRIGDNNHEVVIPVKTADELGLLARSFESMNKKLLFATKNLKTQAFTDSLTGLPNRLMFHDYLGRLLARSKRNNSQFALLFIDLDDFKVVNDSLGHGMGDILLKSFAQRISASIRVEDFITSSLSEEANDFIARLGGDEFIVVLHDVKKSNDITVVAQRIIQTLSQPIMLNDYEHFGSTSLGVSVYPHDGDTMEGLIKNADIAMYHAKALGKNTFQFYSKELGEEQEEINRLESELRKSIQSKTGLQLHFQPKIALNPNRVGGFEALIRWTLENGDSVNPEKMIYVAEQRNLIVPLTEWIVDEACRQNALWQKNNLIKVPIAVNFSGTHIVREDISEMIVSALTRHGLKAEYFEVEMTESSVIDSSKGILESLEKIRALGMSIAVDDFGTGFSSLSYLSNFPITSVKIDRTFVSRINQGNHSAIVTAIIHMSHALGHSVVAEGVETQDQLDFLARENCDYIQGFYFSKPLLAHEVEAFVEKFSA
ncbi:bifunctional diguanylate cyclase/phosphodiesterase [Neptunomonas qingdaonensis]|uniref:Diguanylate cyclase (GGDEF) domain-containing protein n=1 Tax=Neptunomonas qingdaonensis TaxID=1045558 RepID=A0A1I2LPN2_9GAMM|nr:EAL domain-containing protein [Neptunomonas qingdaonensis]SFF81482.1 diguanylate cyclase (GGDEF) domain-containing protein [Neptunomonas qingdaonensis]